MKGANRFYARRRYHPGARSRKMCFSSASAFIVRILPQHSTATTDAESRLRVDELDPLQHRSNELTSPGPSAPPTRVSPHIATRRVSPAHSSRVSRLSLACASSCRAPGPGFPLWIGFLFVMSLLVRAVGTTVSVRASASRDAPAPPAAKTVPFVKRAASFTAASALAAVVGAASPDLPRAHAIPQVRHPPPPSLVRAILPPPPSLSSSLLPGADFPLARRRPRSAPPTRATTTTTPTATSPISSTPRVPSSAPTSPTATSPA